VNTPHLCKCHSAHSQRGHLHSAACLCLHIGVPVTFRCWQNWLVCVRAVRFVVDLFFNGISVYQLSPRVPTCTSCCHSLCCMSVLFTPRYATFLRLSIRSTSPCFFLPFKVFPWLLLLWLCSASQRPLLCDHILLIGLIPVPYPVCADTTLCRLRVIDTFLVFVLKFRPFSLYSSCCISPHFLMFCSSYCIPFDLERFAFVLLPLWQFLRACWNSGTASSSSRC